MLLDAFVDDGHAKYADQATANVVRSLCGEETPNVTAAKMRKSLEWHRILSQWWFRTEMS